MRTTKKFTPENVNKWNTTFHKILLNYLPILVFLFTGNLVTAIVVRLLLSPMDTKIARGLLNRDPSP